MGEKERYMITYEDDGLVYLFDKKNLKYIISDGSINDKEGVGLCDLLNRQYQKIKELEEENQQLKDRWQKLKDDLMLFYTVGNTSGSYGYNVYKFIFDKMEELEGAKK